MSINLDNLLTSINIICISGKMNALDMEEIGRLYKKIYGHKLYNLNKKPETNKSNESESKESVESESKPKESVESESKPKESVESESKESFKAESNESESKAIDSKEKTDSKETTESNKIEYSNSNESTKSNETDDSEKYYIEYVETIDIEDIVKIHNFFNKYSKINGIFIDNNFTAINLIIEKLKELIQNHIKQFDEKKKELESIDESKELII